MRGTHTVASNDVISALSMSHSLKIKFTNRHKKYVYMDINMLIVKVYNADEICFVENTYTQQVSISMMRALPTHFMCIHVFNVGNRNTEKMHDKIP